MDELTLLRSDLSRQVEHWTSAARRLGRLEDLASPDAWGRLERYLGTSVRDHLRGVIARLNARGDVLRTTLAAAAARPDLLQAQRLLWTFRRHYFRAETTVEFYADAINTRTNPTLGGLLRACDTLAARAMAGVLEPLGYTTPIALTYLENGRGASILKAGLRLWDGGGLSVAAAIKIVRHNLDRPTSLVHEAGHQVAHTAGWNDELARTLESGLSAEPGVARLWAGWASEIAADAVAFVHTGFGSILALHDVLADEPELVLRAVPEDPHPVSYLRVLMGVEMCRLAWGQGPWDDLAASWRALYPLEPGDAGHRMLETAAPVVADVARLTVATPMRAFKGRSLADVVSPDRVSPTALGELERRLGPALFTSSHWIWTECLRLLAITALRAGQAPRPSNVVPPPAEHWMLKLGGVLQAA
jgi:hypothetical protein